GAVRRPGGAAGRAREPRPLRRSALGELGQPGSVGGRGPGSARDRRSPSGWHAQQAAAAVCNPPGPRSDDATDPYDWSARIADLGQRATDRLDWPPVSVSGPPGWARTAAGGGGPRGP